MQVFQPSSYGNVSSVACQQCSSQCDTQLTIILCWFFFLPRAPANAEEDRSDGLCNRGARC